MLNYNTNIYTPPIEARWHLETERHGTDIIVLEMFELFSWRPIAYIVSRGVLRRNRLGINSHVVQLNSAGCIREVRERPGGQVCVLNVAHENNEISSRNY